MGLRDSRITASPMPSPTPSPIPRIAMYSVSRIARRIIGSNRKSPTVLMSNRIASRQSISTHAQIAGAERPPTAGDSRRGRCFNAALERCLREGYGLQPPVCQNLVVLAAVPDRLERVGDGVLQLG